MCNQRYYSSMNYLVFMNGSCIYCIQLSSLHLMKVAQL